jgi:hypothetical protein
MLAISISGLPIPLQFFPRVEAESEVHQPDEQRYFSQ